MNIDWRWRKLFNIIRLGYTDDRSAKWQTCYLLRAKMRADRKY